LTGRGERTRAGGPVNVKLDLTTTTVGLPWSRGATMLMRPKDVGGARSPAKSDLSDEERGLVVSSRELVSDRLGAAIREEKAGIVSENMASRRRLYADTGREAPHD
jgi:hypothetical protein